MVRAANELQKEGPNAREITKQRRLPTMSDEMRDQALDNHAQPSLALRGEKHQHHSIPDTGVKSNNCRWETRAFDKPVRAHILQQPGCEGRAKSVPENWLVETDPYCDATQDCELQ
jgi:hypothetical protein